MRITLAPGERKTVSLSLPAPRLSSYDDKGHQFVVELGTYDITIGSASDGIQLTEQVQVTGS
jgi:Fibronectin type III-like domain